MKTKIAIWSSMALVLVGGFTVYSLMDTVVEKPRSPASTEPSNYDAMKACEKQDVLWGKIQESTHKNLPDFAEFGLFQLLAMSRQEISLKSSRHSDFAPKDWKKYLHRRGSIAKVKIVPTGSHYTGLFQGAECALLRLSLTYKVEGKRPVAPGLALKVLRDGTYSANISALVSLSGQEKDFNFFKNPMSNIVPVGSDFGQKMVHRVFKKVSNFPEELLVNDMASLDAQGAKVQGEVVSPRQLFFVPGSVKSSSDKHDVRADFATIQEGTIVYQIFAAPAKYAAFDYGNYSDEKAKEFLKESEHVADIVTTSEFVASDFGDEGIFFRHQLRYE